MTSTPIIEGNAHIQVTSISDLATTEYEPYTIVPSGSEVGCGYFEMAIREKTAREYFLVSSGGRTEPRAALLVTVCMRSVGVVCSGDKYREMINAVNNQADQFFKKRNRNGKNITFSESPT